MSKEKPFPEYKRKLGPGWWLANSHFTQYMIREWTSFFVAVFSLIYIYELSLFASGARADALNLLKNPGVIAFNVLALLFTLYHAFTWFYLIGKVQPARNPLGSLLRGRFHRRIPTSRADLHSRNRIPPGPLAN